MRTLSVQTHNCRHTHVAGNTAAVQLFPAADLVGSPVVGRSIWNDSTALLTVVHGPSGDLASESSVQIAAGGYYEVPFGYVGEVSGKWAAANGFAHMEEFI
jgi:hypothetical protein